MPTLHAVDLLYRESLDAARCRRWEETTEQMHFTKSSRKSWSLIRRLGAAQNPPRTSHPPVKADAVASHLQVARAPVNKKYKCRVQVEWRYFLQHVPDKSLPPAFTVDEIYQMLLSMKAGTAPCSPGVTEELGY